MPSAPTIGRRARWAPNQGAQVDRSHPLAAGLKFCAAGDMRTDFAGGLPPTIVGAPLRGATAYGEGMSCTGGTGISYAIPTILTTTSVPGAIMLAFSIGTQAADYAALFEKAANSGNREMGMFFTTGDAINYFGWGGTGTGASGLTLTSGRSYVMVVTGPASSSAVEVYVDGTRYTFDGAATANPIQADLKLGATSTVGTNFTGVYSACAIWNRVLSAGEAQMLYADPFCFLRY